MKVLIVNTSERIGGAAIAANRLKDALIEAGIDAKLLVRNKQSNSSDVIGLKKTLWRRWQFIWERIVIWKTNSFKKKNLFAVDIANTGTDITKLTEFKNADIIHLNWINQALLSLKDIDNIIKSGKPVVWTMHDMWTFTGICHIPNDCDKYITECNNCPLLLKSSKKDLSFHTFKRKEKIYSNKNKINIVAVSSWLADKAKQSKLLNDKNISVIPNTLPLSDFKIKNKEDCLKKLSLPNKHMIVFGAERIDNPIKGVDTLLKAINYIVEKNMIPQKELHLLLFGNIKDPEKLLPRIPITYTYFGTVKDNNILNCIYSASDVVVSTSLYETFGQTLIEAQACGCLPVSFVNSGQADIITHKRNGYAAQYNSYKSIADGIKWAITEGYSSISKKSLREDVILRYSNSIVSEKYIKLYRDIIEKQKQ